MRAAISLMRCLVASLMRGESLSAREAVERDTPAASATSASVTLARLAMVMTRLLSAVLMIGVPVRG